MEINFKLSPIDGVIVSEIKKHIDERGWLAELYRLDTIDREIFPVMSYVSLSLPGVKRGPHEHAFQTDYFCFIGPSDFKVILWDNRSNSKTFRSKMILHIGENNPSSLVVPPGVVHGYKNIGGTKGLVINAANKLYAGEGKKEPVDEIRHEKDPGSIFTFD